MERESSKCGAGRVLWACGWRREGSKKRRSSALGLKEKEDESGVEELGREKEAGR